MTGAPFKGLSRFEDTDLDASLFFGRQHDRDVVVANLQAARLTVLYGESGVGKSSLLRAGVAHHLRGSAEPAVVVVFDAWQGNPSSSLRQALADAVGIMPARSLADTVEACSAVAGGDVYLLLDQVDEYFLYHPHETGPGTFSEELPDTLRRPGLRAGVLLALREDTLARLDVFKARIPNLLGNTLRLHHLDRAGGRAAILGPVEAVNRGLSVAEQIEIEPELVDLVLDEVAAGKLDLAGGGRTNAGPEPDGRIETPYLQLVMRRLWEAERAEGSRTLRVETLRRLGGSEQIVRDQLRGALDGLSPADQAIASAVFNHLVTPSGTKISHRVGDLAEYAHVDEAVLARVLARLATERILRPVADDSGEARYEIYHDVLADAALAWKRRHDLDRELEVQRVEAGRRHRHLLVALVAAGALVAVMAGVTAFALTQRSHARSQARIAKARELVAVSLSQLGSDPSASLRSAVQAARLAPSTDVESALRQALLASRERAVLRAGGPVEVARYSADGSRILTAGADGIARLYEAPTHRLIAALDHGAPVSDAIFGPDLRLVLTAGDDGTVKVWSAADGRLRRTLRHGPPVLGLAISRDEKRIVAVGGAEASLWRIEDGVLLVRWRSRRPLTHAAFGPGGRLVAVAGSDQHALLYSTVTHRLVRRLDQGASVTALAFLPGGRAVVTGGKNGTVVIWNVASGRRVHELRPGPGSVLDLAISPRGALVGTASSDGLGRIWRVHTGALVSSLVGHTNPVTGIAFSPDGSFAVTSSGDKTARIWKVDNGDERAVLAGHGDAVDEASFSPDGKTVLTASEDGSAGIWDPSAQPRLAQLASGPGPVARAQYLDRNFVLIVGAEGGRVVRASNGDTVRRLASGPVSAAAVDTDVTTVALASERLVKIVDRAEGTTRATLPQPVAVKALSFSPDGSRLAVAGADGVARIWRLDGRLDRALRGHRDGLTDIVYSLDGTRLATSSRDGTARVWNTRSGASEHVLRDHAGAVTSVAFSPDGRRVLTAGTDGDARLWDAASGAPIRSLVWHFGAVEDASFSPDGRWIVTAGPATAQIWPAGSKTPLLPFGLGGHTRPLTSAVFDPSSRVVLTAGLDGTVRTYGCRLCGGIDELLPLAEARLAAVGSDGRAAR
jgi:WD40 repeat protein